MSKRNSESDVLVNRLNVGLAKHQKLLASWLGPKSKAELEIEKSNEEQEQKDFQEEGIDSHLVGVGGQMLKEIEDGTFKRRTQTSQDKLLQQLLGAKAAKAHKAAKQAPKEHIKPQKLNHSTTSKADDSDDEGGRAATFISKRRKTSKIPPIQHPEPFMDKFRVTDAQLPLRPTSNETISDDSTEVEKLKAETDDPEDTSINYRPKPKLGNYLDEILAERAQKMKKKKKRNRSQENV
ncbi:hypothetical protein CC78DRAFT_530492 [Lojkania enalia]|uniref:Uncharacterized protein n=1 Tax=Lojkania enalia TaxID=147567 RepID=A0A9P4KJC5_9PLEO|nr:hypothetical protein CC78DRAFT_530492 [Didymosphaeria enalia]